MRIAIPLANGLLCQHFGHCTQFAFFDVSSDGREALKGTSITPPEHAPGLLPRWLRERRGAYTWLQRAAYRALVAYRDGGAWGMLERAALRLWRRIRSN